MPHDISHIRYAKLSSLKAAAANSHFVSYEHAHDAKGYFFTNYMLDPAVAAFLDDNHAKAVAYREANPVATGGPAPKPVRPAGEPKVTKASVMRGLIASMPGADRAAIVAAAEATGMKRSTAITLYGDIINDRI